MADNTNREQVELNQKLKNLKKEILSLTEKTTRLSETEVKKLSELRNEYKEIYIEKRKAESEQSKNFSDQIKSAASLSSLYQNLTSLERDRIEKSIRYKSLTDDQQKSISRIAELNRELAQTSYDESELKKSILADIDIEKAKLGKVHYTQQSIVDNLTQQTEEALVLGNLTKTQKEFLEKQLSVYDGIKDTIGGVLETAELLLSTNKGMFGAALIGAGAFIGKLGEVRSQLGGISEIGTTALSFIDDNAVENAKELANQFGGISNVSMELQASTSLISTNMGISGTEAAGLLGSFSRLNDGSSETALNLTKSTQEFAKQNGLIPSQLMEDLAGSAEEFALFGKQGGKNLIEAGAAARKMGVSLKTMAGIADNLLDFESSITKELELSAMMGRSINLDRARSLAYQGKLKEATEETLTALGGVDAFNKMDYFQKKATAELLGTSVDELSKMVSNQEEAAKLSGTLSGNFSMAGEAVSAGLNKYLGVTVQGLGGALIAVGQMGAGLSTIGIDLKGMVKSSFDFVKNLIKGNALTQAQKTLSDKQIAAGFGGKKAKDMLMGRTIPTVQESIKTSQMVDASNPAKKGGFMDSISKINMSSVLKGAAAMLVVAGAVFVFGKAVQEFMKVSWEAVGMAVVSMLALVGAVALLGTFMTSPIGAVAILAGAAAMLIIATSVLVLGNALQAIGSGFDMMSSGISTLLPNLVGVGMAIDSLTSFIPAISALSLSLMGLAGSLVAVGAAGLLATPGLVALATVGTIATGVGSILGINEESNTSQNDTMNMLLEEIKGLRNDLNSGKVAVYMDGAKVTASVSKVVSKVATNQYI
jgi:hypothetical protein